MTAIPEGGWLYTRGPQSARLVREENSKGCVRLFVHGPGTELVTYEFGDVTECMKRQAQIELNLLAAGYQLAQPSSDSCRENGEGRGPDHRRAAS